MTSNRAATADDAKIIREMVRHEDNVLSSRVGWFCTLEGLLFAAAGLVRDKPDAIFLSVLLSIAGLIVAASTLYATVIATRTMIRLTKWWDDNRSEEYSGPDIIGFRADNWAIPVLRPSRALPGIFIFLWGALLVRLFLINTN